jgi:hypothetical protein
VVFQDMPSGPGWPATGAPCGLVTDTVLSFPFATVTVMGVKGDKPAA